ncbi:MAG: maltose ABC transporter periplasmic protein [Chloroflexi bacterium ADurb.Bin222]|nr:MAG: maltose ABC transporter periplasmic protein [Chloroflexi bacterium ADurb.Bin222]
MKIRLMLVVTVLWGLTACANVPSSPIMPPATSPTPSPTPPALPRPTPLPGSDLTTLTLWVPDVLSGETAGEAHPLLLAQIEAFSRQHTNIQVQVLVKKAQGAGGLYDLLSTAFSAAPVVLPDLVILEHDDLRAAAKNGFVVALPPDELTDSIFPFASDAVTFDERVYGLPFLSEVSQAVYTPRLDVAAPLSWTKVLTGGYALLFPTAPAADLADDFLLEIYQGSGGQVADAEGRPLLDRPHLEELYRFMAVMVEAGLLDSTRLATLPDARACWETFQTEAVQSNRPLLSAVPAGVYWSSVARVGAASWAPTRDGQPFALAEVWSLALVSTDSAHEDAALQLAHWLNEGGQAADLSLAVAMLPPSQEALALWPLSTEGVAFLEQLLPATVLSPSPTVDQPVRRALQAGLNFLLTTEDATPEQAATYALTVLRK